MMLPTEVKLVLTGFGLCVLAVLCMMFCGCSATSNVTDDTGSPLFTDGPVCVNTSQGRVCYTPNAHPGLTAATTVPLEK